MKTSRKIIAAIAAGAATLVLAGCGTAAAASSHPAAKPSVTQQATTPAGDNPAYHAAITSWWSGDGRSATAAVIGDLNRIQADTNSGNAVGVTDDSSTLASDAQIAISDIGTAMSANPYAWDAYAPGLKLYQNYTTAMSWYRTAGQEASAGGETTQAGQATQTAAGYLKSAMTDLKSIQAG
jgi:hypothetical protein